MPHPAGPMKTKVAYLAGLRGVAALVVALAYDEPTLYPRYPDATGGVHRQ